MELGYARRSDNEQVIGLWKELIDFYGENFEHYGSQVDEGQLQRSFNYLLANDGFQLIVAREGELVLGTCTLHCNPFSSWTNSHYGRLEDLIVTGEHRGKGIGKGLVDFSLKTARKEGLTRVELHVLADNQRARRLYLQAGFENNSSLVYSHMLL